ncbi:MAG TPA: hypothetical protein PK264_08175 [Hyphomicrobiaceae bacterium]|nr:hypothetical protein [Hyphomicrobiaceae bacterium]
MLRTITTTAIAALTLGLYGWSSMRGPDCLYRVCIGAPLPPLTELGPAAGKAVTRPDGVLEIDIRSLAPFADIVQFRPPFPTPAREGRATFALLRISRDTGGRVDQVSLIVEFAEGSYLWAPQQGALLDKELARLVGAMGKRQEANWMRRYVWERLNRWRGTRVTGEVWPGTGGIAALKLDLGTTAKVRGVEK